MIFWTAQCESCGVKQPIPEEHRNFKAAQAYAAAWQVQHNQEVHLVDTVEETSEEGS